MSWKGKHQGKWAGDWFGGVSVAVDTGEGGGGGNSGGGRKRRRRRVYESLVEWSYPDEKPVREPEAETEAVEAVSVKVPEPFIPDLRMLSGAVIEAASRHKAQLDAAEYMRVDELNRLSILDDEEAIMLLSFLV